MKIFYILAFAVLASGTVGMQTIQLVKSNHKKEAALQITILFAAMTGGVSLILRLQIPSLASGITSLFRW
jgi:hypothetical protein